MIIKFRPALSVMFTLSLATIVGVGTLSSVFAQEQETKEQAAAEEDADEKEQEKPDPFALPEGSPEELLTFVDKVKRMRPANGTPALEHLKSQVDAIMAASEILLKQEDQELVARGAQEKLIALSVRSRYDQSARETLTEVAETFAKDANPELAKLGQGQLLRSRAAIISSLSSDEQSLLVDDLFSYIGKHGLDTSSYSLASGIGRTLSYSDTPEVGAVIYERLSKAMETAEDERLRSRASKMLGAARRLRLPGNFMEITGRTADGEEFDWASYRGKVVLVDFWASWCGPCRAEIPNMKNNLEKYGEAGFDIVGVNLDTTYDKYKQYVEKEGLTWTNLMSDKPEEMGWDNPLANHYGVTGIPTAILVDQEGKVVSLAARGNELNRLLEELLGEPETPAEKTEESTAGGQ